MSVTSAVGLAAAVYGLLELYVRFLGRPVLDRAFRAGWTDEALANRWLLVRAVSGSALALGVATYVLSVVL